MTIVPEFLYKVYRSREHAEDFMNGRIVLGHLSGYKNIEDPARKDANEGTSHRKFLANDITCDSHGEWAGPLYLFCTSGPEADRNHLLSLGEYIIKINNPKALLDNINENHPQYIRLAGICSLEKVEYDRGDFTGNNPTEFSYISEHPAYCQKSKEYSAEKEWRYVVHTQYSDETCECFRITYRFKKKPDYLEPLY